MLIQVGKEGWRIIPTSENRITHINTLSLATSLAVDLSLQCLGIKLSSDSQDHGMCTKINLQFIIQFVPHREYNVLLFEKAIGEYCVGQ